MKAILRLLIRSYQLLLRPLLHFFAGGPCCRYTPSCSNYFLQALDTHGLIKGSWLGTCRICRCHPWASHGHDPVPPKDSSSFQQHSPQT